MKNRSLCMSTVLLASNGIMFPDCSVWGQDVLKEGKDSNLNQEILMKPQVNEHSVLVLVIFNPSLT